MDERLVERGVGLVGEVGQVMPGEAEGLVAEVYADVQRVLGVPFVNSVFRVLAHDPDWLACVWRAFAPAAAAPAVGRAVERLHRTAAPPAPPPTVTWGVEDDDLEALAAYTAGIHHVLPYLLLFASAAARALEAPDPAPEPPPLGDADPVQAPTGVVDVGMVDPAEAGHGIPELLGEIAERHGHPAPATWFRGLARHPPALRAAWRLLDRRVGTAGHVRVRDTLVAQASEAVWALGLPARLAGCRPGERDRARALVAAFHRRMIPDLLVDVAFVRPALDRASAG